MLDTPILVGLVGKPERLEHSNSSTVGESGERVSSSHLTSIAQSATGYCRTLGRLDKARHDLEYEKRAQRSEDWGCQDVTSRVTTSRLLFWMQKENRSDDHHYAYILVIMS